MNPEHFDFARLYLFAYWASWRHKPAPLPTGAGPGQKPGNVTVFAQIASNENEFWDGGASHGRRACAEDGDSFCVVQVPGWPPAPETAAHPRGAKAPIPRGWKPARDNLETPAGETRLLKTPWTPSGYTKIRFPFALESHGPGDNGPFLFTKE